MASEHAFMKKGKRVSFGYKTFNSFRRLISSEPLIASEKVRNGMVRDSVIVFVIAFFIPVIYCTLKQS